VAAKERIGDTVRKCCNFAVTFFGPFFGEEAHETVGYKKTASLHQATVSLSRRIGRRIALRGGGVVRSKSLVKFF
jgi:hypothetical protein